MYATYECAHLVREGIPNKLAHGSTIHSGGSSASQTVASFVCPFLVTVQVWLIKVTLFANKIYEIYFERQLGERNKQDVANGEE